MNLDIRIISRDINEMLWKSKKTLSTAESCTSGRVATVLTATPGSSEYYLGGIVCYADKVKEELLGVDQQLIETKTSVCEEVVKQLVLGSNKLFHSDYAVAVSGYAGPGGGTPEIPVGTIWIAVGNEETRPWPRQECFDCHIYRNADAPRIAEFASTKQRGINRPSFICPHFQPRFQTGFQAAKNMCLVF